MKIGYFIPEFPSQTHNFFWRERQALQELGIDTSLISTRRPNSGTISPSWSKEAQSETAYLFPLSFLDVIHVFITSWTSGPKAWTHCIGIVVNAPDMSPIQKLRLMFLTLIAAKLVRLSKQQGWSHVHVHSCADAANIAMFASILSTLTYSLTLHNSLYVYGSNQEQKWYHAKFGVVINQKTFEEIHDKLAAYIPEHIQIAPMGVDCNKFKRSYAYFPYDGEGVLRLFSCGRLNLIKGHAYLIAAVDALRKKGINVRLEIAGEDEKGGHGYRKELEQLVQDLNLGEIVTFLGSISEESLKLALEKAHIFILASLDEGVPVAPMEAMAMEIPVVVTDVGGVTELVDNGIDGIVVPPQNSDAIVNSVLQIVKSQDLAMRLSRNGRDKIVTSFTQRRSAKTIANLLENI